MSKSLKTMLIISHDLQTIHKVSDKILLLSIEGTSAPRSPASPTSYSTSRPIRRVTSRSFTTTRARALSTCSGRHCCWPLRIGTMNRRRKGRRMDDDTIEDKLEEWSVKYTELQYFKFTHLPKDLAMRSRRFAELAIAMASDPFHPEMAAGLRHLLEAKDCAVRAALP